MSYIDFLSDYCEENGCNIKKKESLKKYTSFKIGGVCDLTVFPHDICGFVKVVQYLKSHGIGYLILGNGSNVLVNDEELGGVVIFTGQMNKISVDNCIITAECGANLSSLCAAARDNELSGIEFLYGIPGSVGGAVYMNAGAYGGEISDVVMSSRYLDMDGLEEKVLTCDCHKFSYRHSFFSGKDHIILSSELKLIRSSQEKIAADMAEHMSARKEKQPLDYPSAGSVFKRYPGFYTAQLIDECGLKGYTVGGAQVSEKHAGFIINKGGASFSDVVNLIEIIKCRIKDRCGIDIECEIKVIEKI